MRVERINKARGTALIALAVFLVLTFGGGGGVGARFGGPRAGTRY